MRVLPKGRRLIPSTPQYGTKNAPSDFLSARQWAVLLPWGTGGLDEEAGIWARASHVLFPLWASLCTSLGLGFPVWQG